MLQTQDRCPAKPAAPAPATLAAAADSPNWQDAIAAWWKAEGAAPKNRPNDGDDDEFIRGMKGRDDGDLLLAAVFLAVGQALAPKQRDYLGGMLAHNRARTRDGLNARKLAYVVADCGDWRDDILVMIEREEARFPGAPARAAA